MSSGHWGDLPYRVEEVGNELAETNREDWRLLGQRIQLIGKALKRVDYALCYDCRADDDSVVEAVRAAVGTIEPNSRLAEELRQQADRLQVLASYIESAEATSLREQDTPDVDGDTLQYVIELTQRSLVAFGVRGEGEEVTRGGDDG